MSFLLNKDFFDRLAVASESSDTELSPFADWMHAQTRDKSRDKSQDKTTQTDPMIETLLGQIVLANCPNPMFVNDYVDHVNTSRELVQLLKRGSPPEQPIRNGLSRSSE